MPFSRDDFACKCCGKSKIDDKVVELCKRIEQAAGMPLTVNSGHRCETHNRAVGGKPNSEHTKGRAADIACGTSRNWPRLARRCGRNCRSVVSASIQLSAMWIQAATVNGLEHSV